MRFFSLLIRDVTTLAGVLCLIVFGSGAWAANGGPGSPGTATPTPHAPAPPPTPARPAYNPPLLDNGRSTSTSPRPADSAVPMLEQQLQRNQQPAPPAPGAAPKTGD